MNLSSPHLNYISLIKLGICKKIIHLVISKTKKNEKYFNTRS